MALTSPRERRMGRSILTSEHQLEDGAVRWLDLAHAFIVPCAAGCERWPAAYESTTSATRSASRFRPSEGGIRATRLTRATAADTDYWRCFRSTSAGFDKCETDLDN
jgi:hypothetical protein